MRRCFSSLKDGGVVVGKGWQGDMKIAANDFEQIVWPAIRSLIGGGEYLSTELSSDPTHQTLDQLAGIDAWQITEESVFGLAQRVQRGRYQGHTFTWRLDRPSGAITEVEKRLRAHHNGSLQPFYTIHAYVSDGLLLSAGVIKTADLCEYRLTHGPDGVRTNPQDGVRFEYFEWRNLRGKVIIV